MPVLAPGELITAEAIESLREIKADGGRIAYAADPSLATFQVIVRLSEPPPLPPVPTRQPQPAPFLDSPRQVSAIKLDVLITEPRRGDHAADVPASGANSLIGLAAAAEGVAAPCGTLGRQFRPGDQACSLRVQLWDPL